MSRNIITGIDVGTYYVKVIIANAKEKNEKGLPKIIASGTAETRGVRHGYVTNVRDVAQSIKKALSIAEEKAQLKIKKAFIGISGIGLSGTTVSSFVMTSRADAEITSLDLKNLHDQCEKDIPKAEIAKIGRAHV